MNVLIEIPKGSKIKYEMDKETDVIKADRIVPLPYPENYGYFPDTLAEDNDPLDVFVISDHSFAPGTQVEIVPVGLIEMWDNGEPDHKILAIFMGEDELEYMDIRIQTIRDFLTIYKPNVKLGATLTGNEDEAYIVFCEEAFKKLYNEMQQALWESEE